MKSPNLDYRRLADQLVDRGMIENDAMQHVFQECSANGLLMPEVLVSEGMISDLEISRICTELFHLPFVPLESYEPATEVMADLDQDYLRQYGLVPLDRFGDIMTVSMPGIVPTAVLNGISDDESIRILPVVGTVKGNRRWLDDNLASQESTALEAFSAAISDEDASWGDLFDAGDESVKQELQELPAALSESNAELEMPLLDLDDLVTDQEKPSEPDQQTIDEDDLFDLDALDGLDDIV